MNKSSKPAEPTAYGYIPATVSQVKIDITKNSGLFIWMWIITVRVIRVLGMLSNPNTVCASIEKEP